MPIPVSGTPDIISEASLASYLQRTIPTGNAEVAVRLANGLVRDVIGDVNPVPARVEAITLEVAARGYRNPQALSSETREIDDYNKTERREGAALVAPGVYLTDEEKAELLGILAELNGEILPRRRVGSIRLRVPLA